MIPAAVEYLRAGSVAEALDALADPEAKIVAGGHSLIPMMKLRFARPSRLVDIRDLDLAGVSHADGTIRIGAMTTYDDLVRASASAPLAPALYESAASVGDLQVRNAGTLGGGIAHGDPACDIAAGALAVEAVFRLQSPSGVRDCDAADFFRGMFTTALEQQELLIEIVVPSPQEHEGSAYRSVEGAASGYALAGAAARVKLAEGVVVACKVSVTGAAVHPLRATEVEQAVIGAHVSQAPGLARAASDTVPVACAEAEREYRRHLVAVVIERAMAAACATAQDLSARDLSAR